MATDPRTHSVTGLLVKATERAVLVEVHYIDTTKMEPFVKEWFPKTQVTEMIITSEDDRIEAEIAGDEIPLDEFTIKHWILSEKGLVK